MVRIQSKAFSLQKGGNEPKENEDSFFPAVCGEHAAGRLSYAISDGATEGMLSAYWSALLVKLYRRRWLGLDAADDWLAHAYRDWQQFKTDYVRRREADGHPIQWYEEPGLEAGAFATLLGVTFRSSESENEGADIFETIALGDSCLFQIRDGMTIRQFPLMSSSEFNNRPLLISSNPARNSRVLENFRFTRGDWRTGDRFYLMTDALAAWSIREEEAGHAPWPFFEALETPAQTEPFAEFIARVRGAAQIRNDDVTCVRLQVM